MLKKYLIKIKKGQNLTAEEAGEIIDLMSTGEVLPVQIADLLVSLNAKEENIISIYDDINRLSEGNGPRFIESFPSTDKDEIMLNIENEELRDELFSLFDEGKETEEIIILDEILCRI